MPGDKKPRHGGPEQSAPPRSSSIVIREDDVAGLGKPRPMKKPRFYVILPCMGGKASKPGTASKRSAKARSVGEGAPRPTKQDRKQHAALAEEEERVLRCLGAAVIMQWNDLPMKIQRALFESAISMGDPLHTLRLKGQIARFLHKHKNAARKPD